MNINVSDVLKSDLKPGQLLYIAGEIYTARDAAHKKLVELIKEGKPLPFNFNNQAVYYAGPTDAKPNKVIGSIGPTTSCRMDAYSPILIEHGLKIMIGKGERSPEVEEAIKKHKGIYFATIGGAAALLAKTVKSAEIIAFPELGTEAIRKLYVENFPVIVAISPY